MWLVVELVLDHFGFRQGKNVKVTMKFEVPKRHILRPTLSTNMIQWVLWWEKQIGTQLEKRQGPITKKYYNNKILMIVFGEREDKNNCQTWFIFFIQKLLFKTHIKKNHHIHFWSHGHSPWSTFGLQLH